jgi:hypothetical protein
MLKKSRLVRVGMGIGLVIVLLGALAWGAFQPWTANHFGYALPGPDRLPYRISYAGRDYGNPYECAGADWCQPAAKHCNSAQQLMAQNLWPLQQVSSISTLFGAAYPVLAPSAVDHLTQVLLFVPYSDDCYLTYALEGGP